MLTRGTKTRFAIVVKVIFFSGVKILPKKGKGKLSYSFCSLYIGEVSVALCIQIDR